jgi:hypothetical protein
MPEKPQYEPARLKSEALDVGSVDFNAILI